MLDAPTWESEGKDKDVDKDEDEDERLQRNHKIVRAFLHFHSPC